MRHLPAALALAFTIAAMSVAQACPDSFETVSTPSQVASTDKQAAPPSTKIRIPMSPQG